MGEHPDDVAALEANLWSLWRQFGSGEGCRLIDEPAVLRFETPVPHVPYNTVLRFSGDDADLDAVLAAYRSRRVPLVWVLHPTAPADLGARLAARGLEEAERITGMAARLAGVPAPEDPPVEVRVDELGPGEHEPYLELLTWRYGLPPDGVVTLRSIIRAARFGAPGSPNRSWVARRGGEVLCKVTLHLDGRVAGVHGVVTRPEARGLGLARLLTLTALGAARDAGYELAVLHSTPMAVSLYRAMGFEPRAAFGLWAEPDTLHL